MGGRSAGAGVGVVSDWPPPGVDLVVAARSVRPVIEAHADEAEEQRRLPRPVVDALVSAGLTRMCVPAVYGGPEVDPLTLVEAIEAVAVADGAAGWCSMISSTTSSMSMFLEPAVARAIYGDPLVVTGGVYAPNGVGVTDGDGFRVSGRWQWGSGTQHCQWITGGTRCDDGTFRLCWFPAAEVELHDTWHSVGMRGTGSLDFSVDEVYVPADHTIQPGVSTPRVHVPLSAFPNYSLLAAGVAAVALGVARRALDELVELAAGKRPLFSSRTLAQSPFTQIELARAEARLGSARSYLLGVLGEAWQAARNGQRVGVDVRAAIRLACVNAAESAAVATDTAYTLAGGTSVYEASLLQRCLRDAHVATQHLMVAPKLYETLGRLRLGIDADVSAL